MRNILDFGLKKVKSIAQSAAEVLSNHIPSSRSLTRAALLTVLGLSSASLSCNNENSEGASTSVDSTAQDVRRRVSYSAYPDKIDTDGTMTSRGHIDMRIEHDDQIESVLLISNNPNYPDMQVVVEQANLNSFEARLNPYKALETCERPVGMPFCEKPADVSYETVLVNSQGEEIRGCKAFTGVNGLNTDSKCFKGMNQWTPTYSVSTPIDNVEGVQTVVVED